MVRVQEERFLFSGAPHFWHCLLQTNQYTVFRVGWKCADHRHGFFLRTIALRNITPYSLFVSHHFTIRDTNATRHCSAVMPTPQDSDEIMTAKLVYF